MPPLPMRARWPSEPVALALAGLVLLQGGALLPPSLLRAVLTLPPALLLPGTSMLLALFGTRLPLDAGQRTALAMILSLANYPLLALGLYGCGLTLTTAHLLPALDVELLLVLAAAYRRAVATPSIHSPPRLWSAAALRTSGVGAIAWRAGLAAAGLLTTLVVARALVATPPLAPFTQLYLTGDWGRLASVAPVSPGQSLRVMVGVENHTGRSMAYRLAADIDGTLTWPARPLALPAGAGWSGPIAGTVPVDTCLHRLRIQLTDGAGVPGGLLTLWLQGRGSGPCPAGSVPSPLPSSVDGPPAPATSGSVAGVLRTQEPPISGADTAQPARRAGIGR